MRGKVVDEGTAFLHAGEKESTATEMAVIWWCRWQRREEETSLSQLFCGQRDQACHLYKHEAVTFMRKLHFVFEKACGGKSTYLSTLSFSDGSVEEQEEKGISMWQYNMDSSHCGHNVGNHVKQVRASFISKVFARVASPKPLIPF